MLSCDPEPLRELYAAYYDPKRYQQLAEANLRKVVGWRWATDNMFKGRPFEKECHTIDGRWRKEGEEEKLGDSIHGLDGEGRILIIRGPWLYGDKDDILNREETQWLYEEGKVTAIVTGRNRKPDCHDIERVEVFLYETGRVSSHQTFDDGSGHVTSYVWSDGRLARSVRCSWRHEMYVPNDSEFAWQGVTEYSCNHELFEYDDQGQLDKIWLQTLDENRLPDESWKKLVYRRLRKGETIPALSAAIEAMLLAQIPEAVKEAKVQAAVYCVLVCYCGEDCAAGWPPFLVLGSEQERQRILKEGADVGYYLWAPDEMRQRSGNVELHLSDPILNEKCEIHSQLMELKNSFSAVRKVLQKVVQSLNEFRWAEVLETTPDFIVAFVDNTGQRASAKDIKLSISEEKFEELKSRGLI